MPHSSLHLNRFSGMSESVQAIGRASVFGASKIMVQLSHKVWGGQRGGQAQTVAGEDAMEDAMEDADEDDDGCRRPMRFRPRGIGSGALLMLLL